MSLLSVIKQAGVEAMEARDPVNVLYGEVTSISPLEVNVDQRFTLTADFLVITERVTRYEVQKVIDFQHTHQYVDEWENINEEMVSDVKTTDSAGGTITLDIVIREGLELGDKVLLLRVQGGQKYVILDKVVST